MVTKQPMQVHGKHFCFEESATYYSFVVVEYCDVTMFMDVNSAWCGSVPTRQIKKAVVAGGDELEALSEYMTDSLYLSKGFIWSRVDAKNIIDGYLMQYHDEFIKVES